MSLWRWLYFANNVTVVACLCFQLCSGRSLEVPLQDNDVFKSPKRSDGLCPEHHLQSIVLVNQAQLNGHEDSPYKHAHREAGMAHCFAKTTTNILTHRHTHTNTHAHAHTRTRTTHATTLRTSVDDKEKKNNSTSVVSGEPPGDEILSKVTQNWGKLTAMWMSFFIIIIFFYKITKYWDLINYYNIYIF